MKSKDTAWTLYSYARRGHIPHHSPSIMMLSIGVRSRKEQWAHPSSVWGWTGGRPYGTALFVGPNIKRSKMKIREGVRGHSVWWSYEGIAFGCVYLSPSLGLEECKRMLTSPMSSSERQDQDQVIIGDLNMRLGALVGDRSTNCRGRQLGNPHF